MPDYNSFMFNDQILKGSPTADTSHDLATADLWFDPLCPWAWLTSRWLLEVTAVRPVTVRWHVMSLAILNAGTELSEDYARWLELAWGPARVVNAARLEYGPHVVPELYTALGRRLHVEGRGRQITTQAEQDELLRESLLEAGLTTDLVAVAVSEKYDADLYASHEAGVGPVGTDVGTPIIHVPGPDGESIAFFGPVVSPAPKGEEAGRLWDGTLLVAGTPGFFEIKRSRSHGPLFD